MVGFAPQTPQKTLCELKQVIGYGYKGKTAWLLRLSAVLAYSCLLEWFSILPIRLMQR